VARQEAYDWATDPDRAGKFIGAAMTAAMNTIQKHHADEAAKASGKKTAAE